MKIKSVKFNFIMNFMVKMSQFLFPLIKFPYVSRVLQPSGTGSTIEKDNFDEGSRCIKIVYKKEKTVVEYR